MAGRIFVTGGTVDNEYNALNGPLYPTAAPLRDMLKLGRCNLDLEIRTLMMVDSLELSRIDRETIRKNCLECDTDQIVITHGTDTLETTAKMLGQKIKNKTIVLVGAMIPYTFGSPDGPFNLGSALAFAQSLPHGVYIAMNGRYFTWDNVRKNRSSGVFEEIN